MDRKKISTTVYITQEQNTRLKELNQKTKVPIAEYIREGIDLVLERYRHLLPGQMTLLQDENHGKLAQPPEKFVSDKFAPRDREKDPSLDQ